jgi:hypothetical protein
MYAVSVFFSGLWNGVGRFYLFNFISKINYVVKFCEIQNLFKNRICLWLFKQLLHCSHLSGYPTANTGPVFFCLLYLSLILCNCLLELIPCSHEAPVFPFSSSISNPFFMFTKEILVKQLGLVATALLGLRLGFRVATFWTYRDLCILYWMICWENCDLWQILVQKSGYTTAST